MKRVILGLKGVLFGVANVIPGVSGGTIARNHRFSIS